MKVQVGMFADDAGKRAMCLMWRLMMLSQTIQSLQHDEGFSSTPYRDSLGKLTIGYGFTFLTIPEAYHILVGRVDDLVAELQKELPVFNTLDDVRKSVLINMAYNLGLHGLLEFRDMISYLQNHDYLKASEAMLSSKWASEVGNRAHRLALMMETGKWASEAIVQP